MARHDPQTLLSRRLDESPVPALGAAAREDLPIEESRLIRPEDDLSPVPLRIRIGARDGRPIHPRQPRIALRPLALIIAPDQDRPAAAVARSIERRP